MGRRETKDGGRFGWVLWRFFFGETLRSTIFSRSGGFRGLFLVDDVGFLGHTSLDLVDSVDQIRAFLVRLGCLFGFGQDT